MPLDYVEKYDVAGDGAAFVLGKPKDFVVATAADVVSTLWNSIPFTPEIKTEDILEKIDNNALAVFQENTDTIQSVSLIAGSILPATLTLKLLGRARAGLTALGYTENGIGSAAVGALTGQRQKYLSQEISRVFSESGQATAQYRQLTRQLYASNITKEIADNVVIEAAVVASMNAHPYMEDYLKDPVQNFLLFSAIGGGFGTAFAFPMTRRALRDIEAPIATGTLASILEKGYKPLHERDLSFTATARYQRHSHNLKILDDVIASEVELPVTKEIASVLRLAEAAQQTEAVLYASPAIKKGKVTKGEAKITIDDEMRNTVANILSDPGFVGVDKVRFYDMNKIVKETSRKLILEDLDKPGHITELIQKAAQEGQTDLIPKSFLQADGKPAIAFFRPSTNELFAPAGARNASWAVDIPNVEQWLKNTTTGGNTIPVTVPIKDFSEDNLLRSVSAASQDARFLQEVKRFDNLKDAEIPYVAIAPDDLPRQNGFLTYLSKLDPEEANKIKVYIRSDQPSYQEVERFIERTVSKDYVPKAENIVRTTSIFDTPILTREADELLNRWTGGASPDIAILRNAFDAFFRGTHLPPSQVKNIQYAKEIWEAGQGTRDAFRKIADADGYVYLYRGIRGKLSGSAAVESFSVRRTSAKKFSGFHKDPDLFKVHVDNIIGSIYNKSYAGELELLVSSPHHQLVNNIPVETGATRMVHVPTAGSARSFTFDEFMRFYADETERQVRELMQTARFSFEEISARTNVKTSAIHALTAGGNLYDIPIEWRRYSDATKVDEYLHPRNKLFALVGNTYKNPMAESLANLDARALRNAQAEYIEQATILSRSEIANDALNIFRGREMQLILDKLMDSISEINNSLVGNPKIQSADNTLRNLINGPLITYVGKRVIDASDALKRRLIEPVAAKFATFRDNQALTVEFNQAVNKAYGLKGWRDIKVDEATGYGYFVQRTGSGKNLVEEPVKNVDGSIFYIKQKEVIDAIESTRTISAELLKLHNLVRSVTGQAPLNDLGLYLPPISLVNRSFAFVIDTLGERKAQLLVANNEAELANLIQSYKKSHAHEMNRLNIVPKGAQEDYNLIKNYNDYEASVSYASIEKEHTGASSLAIVPSDLRFVENILQSYDNAILQGFRRYTEHYLSEPMAWLDKLSYYYNHLTEGQPKRGFFKENPKNSALTVKNIMLGRDQLEQSTFLKATNSYTDLLINRASAGINSVVKSFSYEKAGSKEFFESLNSKLKEVGVGNPWASFDEYLSTTVAETRNIAPNLVAAGNGMMAMLNLRMFEMAQAAINIMSLPILSWGALMERLPGTLINPEGDAIKLPLRVMYNGMRSMFSDEGLRLERELWEPKGLIDQTVRQYTEIAGITKAAYQGGEFMDKAVASLRGIQENKVVKDFFAKPADWAERFTRRYAMHTGYHAAKTAYPGIDDVGATIAAVAFADRAIGNYHAAQRPIFFQGTFGSMIGLYQTYVLTFAQQIYRSFENRNFKQLAALAMTQAGIFGINSLPGYHMLSEQVVGRISDQHIDLTTGTYRALSDPAAELVLYGLPSSLGASLYTRGELSPRIPSTMGDIALLNGIKQGYSSMVQIAKKIGEGTAAGTPLQSLMEAISLQSMSRPLARWAELVTGSSVTQQGNTMSPAADVWTPTGVFARILGTRPIEEQATRNAQHLNRFYETLDHDRRQDAVNKIRTALRSGDMSNELLSQVALDYLRFGGTSRGWKIAINEVLLKTTEGTRTDLLRKLEPDSPLRRMISDMY